MKTKFIKLVYAAGFLLAMAFIISCCMTPSGYTICPMYISSSSETELSSSSSVEPNSSSSVEPNSSSSVEPSSSSSVEPSSSSEVTSGEFIDSRDRKKYKTVVIGTQTWMAENLNYYVQAQGSVCYDYFEGYCTKYGRLYYWDMAKSACPSGWHLPSDADWDKLISYVEKDMGCNNCAGRYLKAKTDWSGSGNGTDNYGFSALPGSDSYRGGNGYTDGAFGLYGSIGNYGGWWSAKSTDYIAYMRQMGISYDKVMETGIDKLQGYSVRCIRD